jgi:hypothetical protein
MCHETQRKSRTTWHWWLTPIIQVIQEAETRRIVVQSQPGQRVHKTLFRKTLSQKNWAGGVAQGKGHKFKPQDHKKKKGRKKVQNN